MRTYSASDTLSVAAILENMYRSDVEAEVCEKGRMGHNFLGWEAVREFIKIQDKRPTAEMGGSRRSGATQGPGTWEK